MYANLHIDPLSAYLHLEPNEIVEMMGVLPEWAAMAKAYGDSMKEALTANYPFYFGPCEGGTVDSDGVYHYPKDPPLHPLGSLTIEDVPGTCYFYPHAFVAVVTEQETWIARMD